MNIVELAKEAGLQLNVYAESYPVIAHQLEKFYELAFAAGAAQERKKQAEQEPMFFVLMQDHTWLSISEGQYEKVAPEGRMKVYAAPVRTKDLTDDEIFAFDNKAEIEPLAFARAVIAADREKNK